MDAEKYAKLVDLDIPWAIGRRGSVPEVAEVAVQGPVAEFPFFAAKGPDGAQFKVVGSTLEECIDAIISQMVPGEVVDSFPSPVPPTSTPA